MSTPQPLVDCKIHQFRPGSDIYFVTYPPIKSHEQDNLHMCRLRLEGYDPYNSADLVLPRLLTRG